ncbi:methylamine utilization protein MauJ [Trinickia mobilis]|uniref:methylamine utilization protein MauJ n=1 Tax=Trinickia mobilis TaxID=2816356 RepID=UPI001A8EA96A|nr:methylamine utilization protein MauJ [Trinickia mobilis]
MKTPYVPHLFEADALAKVQGRVGWLTVGVVSSIAWSQDDVWVEYDGFEFLLHGVRQQGAHRIAPCISTPSDQDHVNEALSRLYRFTSVLGFFKQGYVDITGRTWGTHIIRHSDFRGTFTTVLQGGKHGFNCNHMPLIEDDQARKALAFLREGRRLERVHEPYAFLSFFKVIESQFASKARVEWVERNLDLITEERALKRLNELRGQGVNVNQHLFESGRCAVAHASVGGSIVDPDVPADRERIAADLDIIAALADRYIKVDCGVPDEMDLYSTRDRVAPWHALMAPEAVATLKAGGHVENLQELGKLEGATVSVRLWPDPPAKQFEAMTLLPTECGDGVVKFIALSARGTIVLAFVMDVKEGRVHTLLNEGGMRAGVEIVEEDVEDYTRYFHSVVGNRIVELAIDGAEPVDCEVIIPVNIIPRAPEEAVSQALEQFRRSRQQPSAGVQEVDGA